MIRKMSIYALDMIRLQNMKFRLPFGKDSVILKECIGFFRNAYGLLYAYEIKRRRDVNESFSINDIHPYWFFDKDIQGNYVVTDFFEFVQNFTIINSVGRPKKELGKKKRTSKLNLLTE
jgi:hypothetical protein